MEDLALLGMLMPDSQQDFAFQGEFWSGVYFGLIKNGVKILAQLDTIGIGTNESMNREAGMARRRNNAHHQAGFGKKPGANPALKWLVYSALAILSIGGLIFVISLTMATIGSSRVPFDESVAGAMDNHAVSVLANELNVNNRTSLQIKVPGIIPDAVEYLDFRTNETGLEPYDQKRKRVAAEWLFGRVVDESYRKSVALSLALAFEESKSAFNRELQISLIRAFQRWGHADFVHQFMSVTANDKLVPGMLEIAQRFPTSAGMDVAVTFLSGKYGDLAERIVAQSPDKDPSLLVAYLDSRDGRVVARVERVLQNWDVDIVDARLDYYLSETAKGKEEYWARVAGIKASKKRRKDVVEGLSRFKPTRQGVDAWLDACLEWGDKSILPAVQEVYASSWSFDRKKAIATMVKYPHSGSVDFLVDSMLDSWTSRTSETVQAIESLQNSGMRIDFPVQVHWPLVQRYSDYKIFTNPDLKALLEATDFDHGLLVDKCLESLEDEFGSVVAIQTLRKMKVVDSRRVEVAKTIQGVIQDGGESGDDYLDCFLQWVTPENSMLYQLIDSESTSEEHWKRALKIALKGEGHIKKVVVPVARAMTDDDRVEMVREALKESGEFAEPLMMFMLKSDNPDEVFEAVNVLQSVGTERCLPEIERVIQIAREKRFVDIYRAAIVVRAVVKGDGELYEGANNPPDETSGSDPDGI